MTNFLDRIRSAPTGLAPIALLALLSIAPAPGLGAQASAVSVTNAWVREVPAGRKTTAVFLVLENSGPTERAVVSGSTVVADTLELHEMKREGGMMAMSPVQRIAVPAKGSVELRPGGLHLMLFGVRQPLAAGDTVPLRLVLDDGSRIEVRAEVRSMRPMP